MLKITSFNGIALAISFSLFAFSCSENDGSLSDTANDEFSSIQENASSSTTPWDFDSSYSTNDEMQVDNDGNAAHNWDEDDYVEYPYDYGFDIRDYIFVESDRLILQCPNGNDSRRAEYRDQTNIDLDRRNKMDLTFDIKDYNNESELVMAQLHNDDSGARRPYIIITAEDGKIHLERANSPSGSTSTTSSETIPFRENDRYRIRMDSPNNSRTIDVRINNLDTGEEARENFSFDSDWNDLDGSFYWKHGAYMPNGGSDNTQQRVETITFATNRTD